MSSNFANGILIAQAGLGPVRASAWENKNPQTGQSMGVSVTLAKLFLNKKTNEFDKTSCSLSLPEVAAALEVLRDVQTQLLARSREITRQPAAQQQVVGEPVAAGTGDQF